MSSIYLVSLGCAKNLVDSEKIVHQFEEEGYSLSSNPENAEILIVNTCGFIQDAVEESIETILELAEIKKSDSAKKLVVSGCMVQRYKESLAKEIPEVDLFVGTTDFHKIPQFLKRGERLRITKPRYSAWDIKRHLLTKIPTGYLKIAEGCSANCSFCIIPKLRGPQVSRSINELVKEAKWMADQGVKELIIVAQDTIAYGRDLKDGSNLTKLLEALLELDLFKWIRLQYLYPENYDDDFLRLFKNSPLIPYFDIPVQHINDNILKKMNRRSDKDTIIRLFRKIKERIPDSVIRTTVIVGFPGETEDEFEELLEFLSDDIVDFFGVFKFYSEEGTHAAKMADQIPEDIKENRLDKISRLAWEKQEEFFTKFIDQEIEALIEEDWDEKFLIGRAWFQGPDADGSILIKRRKQLEIPSFYIVKIEEGEPDIVGVPLKPSYLSTGTK